MDMKENMEEYNCKRPWELTIKEQEIKRIDKTPNELVAKEGVDR